MRKELCYGIKIIILLIVSIIFYIIYFNNSNIFKENFNNILETVGDYPISQSEPLLYNVYKSQKNINIGEDDASDMLNQFPIFKLGSYNQITNNLRYWKNPDNGTCAPTNMCNTLYLDKQVKSNVIKPLEQTPECSNLKRVNYYNTIKI
jgi:hypothetical protein